MGEPLHGGPWPQHGWTCFHCGETFKTPGGAADHFGATPDREPGCMIRVQLGDERGLQRRLREVEGEVDELTAELGRARAENEQLDYEAGLYRSQCAELERRFGSSSVRMAFDAAEGRWLAAEHRADLAEAARRRASLGNVIRRLIAGWRRRAGSRQCA